MEKTIGYLLPLHKTLKSVLTKYLTFLKKIRYAKKQGPVVQRLERAAHNGDVVGSIPSRPTTASLFSKDFCQRHGADDSIDFKMIT